MTYKHWTTVGWLIKRYFCRVFSLELLPIFMYRLNEFFFCLSVTEWWLKFGRFFFYFLYNSAIIEEVTLEEWRRKWFLTKGEKWFPRKQSRIDFFSYRLVLPEGLEFRSREAWCLKLILICNQWSFLLTAPPYSSKKNTTWYLQ